MLEEYCFRHFNAARPDQGIGQRPHKTAHLDATLAEPNAAGEKTTADFVELLVARNP